MAKPGLSSHFRVYGLNSEMDAVWTHRQQIHWFRAGGNTSRSRPPMVGPCRGLGFVSRSMALGGICRILRRPVSAAGGGKRLAKGLHRFLGTLAAPYSGEE